jgi:hypothetical protein
VQLLLVGQDVVVLGGLALDAEEDGVLLGQGVGVPDLALIGSSVTFET